MDFIKTYKRKVRIVGFDIKKHINDRYTGASCFECSCGGIGNSVSFDGSYTVASFVGALTPSSNGVYQVNDLIATSGFGLSNSGSSLGFYKYNSEVSQFHRNGNLSEYIRNLGKLKLYEEEVQVLNDLQSILDNIDKISLKVEMEHKIRKVF